MSARALIFHMKNSCDKTFPWFHYFLKSLGPIDRKFHGHGENDGFVLYEYIIKQFSCFFANIQTSAL